MDFRDTQYICIPIQLMLFLYNIPNVKIYRSTYFVINESEGFFERMLGGSKSIGGKIAPIISKDEEKI